MKWIKDEIRDKVDFVIWTGDSARHDNDEQIPRNAEQVTGFNKLMVQKMDEVFGKQNRDEEDDDPNNDYVIPIIPTIGNNDILPHNVMAGGPNTWTRTFARIWRQFIPEAQKHQFEQGGWFYVEVIPNKLAVFSLNTLFFANNNGAVDGCAGPHEPGYAQLEWLRIQLQFMRDRGVKAILTGHHPPIRQAAKTMWDETCWQKYTLWLRQYRDVIVSSHYGHFNYDHFILQRFKDLNKDSKKGRMSYYRNTAIDGDFEAEVSSDYWIELREEWSKLPHPPKSLTRAAIEHEVEIDAAKSKRGNNGDSAKKKRKQYLKKMGGEYAEKFAASFISPSVVPNLFPTIRIYEYNISDLDRHEREQGVPPPAQVADPTYDVDEDRKNAKKERKHKFTIPKPPAKSSPPGPAYSPQALSLLRYTQLYANLTRINSDVHSSLSDLRRPEYVATQTWKEGKHKGGQMHDKDPEPDPKKFKFQVLYDTQDDDIYRLPDLTMPHLVDLARRIGAFQPPKDESAFDDVGDEDRETAAKKKKHRKGGRHAKRNKRNMPWYTFITRAFVHTKPAEEIDQEFGQ